MNAYAMFGKMTVHPGKRDEMAQILLEAADLLRSNEDCKLYLVNESADEPDVIWVSELWKDAEAHAASLKDEQVMALIRRGMPLIAGVEPVRMRPVGGKGM